MELTVYGRLNWASYLNCAVGCEYGDKAPWCGKYVQDGGDCKRPEVMSHCCYTCAKYMSPDSDAKSEFAVSLLW